MKRFLIVIIFHYITVLLYFWSHDKIIGEQEDSLKNLTTPTFWTFCILFKMYA